MLRRGLQEVVVLSKEHRQVIMYYGVLSVWCQVPDGRTVTLVLTFQCVVQVIINKVASFTWMSHHVIIIYLLTLIKDIPTMTFVCVCLVSIDVVVVVGSIMK